MKKIQNRQRREKSRRVIQNQEKESVEKGRHVIQNLKQSLRMIQKQRRQTLSLINCRCMIQNRRIQRLKHRCRMIQNR